MVVGYIGVRESEEELGVVRFWKLEGELSFKREE